MGLQPGRNEARIVEIDGKEAVEIRLTQGRVAFVDVTDWGLVCGHRWQAVDSRGKFYASSHKRTGKTTAHHLFMHRVLLGITDPGVEVDHRDNDSLNNRRHNLRIATHVENKWNREPQVMAAGRTAPYKGVFLDRAHGRYKAQIQCDGKRISLGYHATPEAAARKYDEKARELFGEFAWLNFPDAA